MAFLPALDPINTVASALLGLLLAGVWAILWKKWTRHRNVRRLVASLQRRARLDEPGKVVDLTYTVHRDGNRQELVADNQGLVRTVKAQMVSRTRVALLTGRFGAGKTTICGMLADSLKDGDGTGAGPLSVVVDVLEFDENPVTDQIAGNLRRAGIETTAAEVNELLRTRQILLILDGLDQLPYRTTGASTLKALLKYAKTLVNDPAAKLTLLLVMRQEFVEISREVQEFRNSHKVPVIQVRGLTQLQIENFIRNVEKSENVDRRLKQVDALLRTDRDLLDLLSMPVILQRFIEAAPESTESLTCTGTTLAQIYRRSFEKLSSSDLESLGRFAFDLFREDRLSEYVDEDVFRQLGGNENGFEHFLERVGILRFEHGSLRFAHASFRDYFVAEHLLHSLREGMGESAFRARIVNYLVAEFVAGLLTRRTAGKLFDLMEQSRQDVVRASAMDILAESEDENIREQLRERVDRRLMSRSNGTSDDEDLAVAVVGAVLGLKLGADRLLKFLDEEGVERLMKALYVTKDGYLYYDRSEDRCHLEWIKIMGQPKYGCFRRVIARVLAEVGEKEAIQVLDKVAKDTSEPEDIRQAARAASVRLQSPPRPSQVSAIR